MTNTERKTHGQVASRTTQYHEKKKLLTQNPNTFDLTKTIIHQLKLEYLQQQWTGQINFLTFVLFYITVLF